MTARRRGAGRPEARSSVVVVGDLCADLVLQLPGADRSIPDCPEPTVEGGGTCGNVAAALARLDVPVAFIGVVGDDGFGRLARAGLAAEGVDVTAVSVDRDAFTALVTAVVDPVGERTVFSWPARGAAHTRLAPDGLDDTAIQSAAWLHVSGMCLVESPVREAVIRAMELARAAHVPVSLDLNLRLGVEDGRIPATYRETLLRAVELADHVLGSAADEIVHLDPTLQADRGRPGGPGCLADWRRVARLLGDGRRTVVARLGRDGAAAVAPTRDVTSPAFAVPVVDTLGAGDAFDAGYIARHVASEPAGDATSPRRDDLADALRWGNACAALALDRAGARGTPRRDELLAFLVGRQEDATPPTGSPAPFGDR